jgi:hypothetical protein
MRTLTPAAAKTAARLSLNFAKIRQAVALAMRETGLETNDCTNDDGESIDACDVKPWSAAQIQGYVTSFDMKITDAEAKVAAEQMRDEMRRLYGIDC